MSSEKEFRKKFDEAVSRLACFEKEDLQPIINHLIVGRDNAAPPFNLNNSFPLTLMITAHFENSIKNTPVLTTATWNETIHNAEVTFLNLKRIIFEHEQRRLGK